MNEYRASCDWQGVVRADTKAEAEAAVFQAMDEGRGVFTVEVELLDKERDE